MLQLPPPPLLALHASSSLPCIGFGPAGARAAMPTEGSGLAAGAGAGPAGGRAPNNLGMSRPCGVCEDKVTG